ncbi:MAG: aspartate racemase [Candidatus Endobugula sp.]|jgi:aspartate racemase
MNNKNYNTRKHNNSGYTLGLLGLGSRSTLFYLKKLNQKYQAKKGGYSTCPLLLLNANFDDINPYLPNLTKPLDAQLSSYFSEFSALAVRRIIIPNITLHESYDRITNAVASEKVSVIHPIKLTIDALKKDQQKKIVIFGSSYTSTSSTLSQHMKNQGILTVMPAAEDIDTLDKIRQRFYDNSESNEELSTFITLLQKYQQQHAVVIACTELSIAFEESGKSITTRERVKDRTSVVNNAVYDMAILQIQEALRQL